MLSVFEIFSHPELPSVGRLEVGTETILDKPKFVKTVPMQLTPFTALYNDLT